MCMCVCVCVCFMFCGIIIGVTVVSLPTREGVSLQYGGERARRSQGRQTHDDGPAHSRGYTLQIVHADCWMEICTPHTRTPGDGDAQSARRMRSSS